MPQIALHQIIRTKRKTLALIVKPDGSLLVRAPLRTSQAVIEEFIEKNRLWIERHQAKALANPPAASREYLPGESFLYLGETYPLQLATAFGDEAPSRRGSRQEQPLLLEDGVFKLAASHQSEAASSFERWYREQARQILPTRVKFFARQYGFHYKGIRITSARTRWGSCSATGSLSFSWRLILAPLDVVDYVVVHELVHTAVHNHSREFWHRVSAILPEYQEYRKWLRDHGRQLLL